MSRGDGWGRELGRLIVGHICIHSTMAGVRMAAPLLVLEQGHGKAAVGVLVACVALGQVLTALPAGRLVQRHGVKLPLAWSAGAAIAAAATAALWPFYAALCCSALLAGAAVGGVSVAMQFHVGRAAPDPARLKQAFSWVSVSPAAANFLGPFAAGLMIDHLGFRAAFVLLGLLPAAAWFLARTARSIPGEPVPAHETSGSAWDLWREAAFRRVLLMNWFMSASWDVHGFMVPVLGHERGLSASVIGTILGSFALAAAGIRLAMPFIVTRVREWVLMTATMAATALLFWIYPLMPSALAMGLCSAGLGMALATAQPIVMSVLHQITPPHRHGEAMAMRLVTVSASNLAMPLLFGAVGGLLGASAVFWTMGTIVGAGSRLALGMRAP